VSAPWGIPYLVTGSDRIMTLVLRELAALEAELAAAVRERRYRTFRSVLRELAAG
jgi:hypothetical protein